MTTQDPNSSDAEDAAALAASVFQIGGFKTQEEERLARSPSTVGTINSKDRDGDGRNDDEEAEEKKEKKLEAEEIDFLAESYSFSASFRDCPEDINHDGRFRNIRENMTMQEKRQYDDADQKLKQAYQNDAKNSTPESKIELQQARLDKKKMTAELISEHGTESQKSKAETYKRDLEKDSAKFSQLKEELKNKPVSEQNAVLDKIAAKEPARPGISAATSLDDNSKLSALYAAVPFNGAASPTQSAIQAPAPVYDPAAPKIQNSLKMS